LNSPRKGRGGDIGGSPALKGKRQGGLTNKGWKECAKLEKGGEVQNGKPFE